MVISHWQKQNALFRNAGLVLSFALSSLWGWQLMVRRPEIDIQAIGMIAMFITFGGVFAAHLLANHLAKSWTRILKFDHEKVEHAFSLIFKENDIQFQKQTEEDGYRYEFPEHSLIMAVKPYSDPDSEIGRKAVTLPTTAVTLSEVTAQNRPFTKKLAKEIDKMASQRGRANSSSDNPK